MIEILSEPTGDRYVSLLDLCATHCSKFLFWVWDDRPQADSLNGVLAILERFLIRRIRGSECPDLDLRHLPGEPARASMFYYRLTTESKAYLQAAVSGVYQWQQPDYPEDLCLLRDDESPFLITLAHHTEAWIEVERALEDELRPALRRMGVRLVGDEIPAYLATLEGHDGPVLDVAVTPDGRHAISAGSDGTLRVWALDTYQCVERVDGQDEAFLSVAVSPDGRRAVAGGGAAGIALVWELATGEWVHLLQG